MNEQELQLIRQKIKFFSENNIKIHIETDKNMFYNGFISDIKDEFIIFNDRMLGEIPIFYLEISKIERYQER